MSMRTHTGELRRLHNKELYGLYSPNIIQLSHQEKWGHVASMGDMKGANRVLVQRPDGNRSLGRLRHRWKDNIITGLQVGWGGMDWTDLAQDSDRW